jgi:hypothetical protein
VSADLLSIREDDLSTSAVRDLLRLHLEGMHAHSPPNSVFALDFSGLSALNVTVWTVWQRDEIAGIGALKLPFLRRRRTESTMPSSMSGCRPLGIFIAHGKAEGHCDTIPAWHAANPRAP